jgi:hypothetical protein
LAKIGDAVGKTRFTDTSVLHGRRLIVAVDIKAGAGTYVDREGNEKPRGDQNVIKSYHSLEGVAESEDQAAPAVASPTGATKAMPWKR